MEYEELLEQLRPLLDEGRTREVEELIAEFPYQDVAALIMLLDTEQRAVLFKLLERSRAAEVFAYLSFDTQHALLDQCSDEETRNILGELTPDDRTALFEYLDAEHAEQLMQFLPAEERAEATELLGYPDESIGRMMTPEYIAVRADWSVEQCLAHMRSQREQAEIVNVVYVTDTNGELLDSLSIRRFLVADPATKVSDLMDEGSSSLTANIAVAATEDREHAVEVLQHYDLRALPVVDEGNRLLGIVTPDDVMDVAEEEATEDFQRIAGVGVLNFSIRDAGLKLLYQRRVGWLVLLVFINMIGGEIIEAYEDTIAAVIVLVTFLPLVVDTGGNAGTQSATLMVRALATGDVRSKDWLRLWGKEAGVAIALGLTVGAAVWALGLYRGGLDIAWVVSLAMTCVVFFGSMIGMLLPFILAKFRLDPATASAPLITSIADIGGILIYFAIATAMLGHMM